MSPVRTADIIPAAISLSSFSISLDYTDTGISDNLKMPSETYFHKFSGEIIHRPKITI